MLHRSGGNRKRGKCADRHAPLVNLTGSVQKPETAQDAIQLLRAVAAERARWADEISRDHGESAGDLGRLEALWFRAAANVIEAGE